MEDKSDYDSFHSIILKYHRVYLTQIFQKTAIGKGNENQYFKVTFQSRATMGLLRLLALLF